jgi:asparagine synthase (glutamine-hydrolysing)
MPGIVGLITRIPPACARQKLTRMMTAMQHHPQYVAGTLIEESEGLYVGGIARPKSFAADMPVSSESGRVSLLFSGEDFPASQAPGVCQQSESTAARNPASYLASAYEQAPAAFPRSLNGRFHAIIRDHALRKLILINDRYGMHRVYYHEGKDAFYFAAEAKAILAACPHLRRIHPRSMGEFISCGCVLDNRTLFEAIHVLPPASVWTFRNGHLEKRQNYFEPGEWEDQQLLDPEGFYESLRATFSGAIGSYFRSQENIGVSLTGGLDSRIIMAWRGAAREIPCYSFGGMYRTCRDVAIARKVASVCGCSHQTIPVDRHFLSKFPHYAERSVYLTDGCIDVSHSPDLFVNEQVATIAPIRLTGNYGGEVLRRVRAFKPMKIAPGLFAFDILRQESTAKERYGEITRRTHPLSFAVFRQAPWHHYGLLSLEQTQVTIRSPFLDNAFVQTLFRAPQTSLLNNDVSLRLIADGDPALGRMPTDRGLLLGHNGPLARARRDLIEFTVKAEYAYDYGMPNWLAKTDRLLAPFHLEKLFLGRHKFYHFRHWYRHSLGAYVQQILLDPRTISRPFFVREGIESVVRDHLLGTRNCTLEIHKALTIELVHRLFVD